jgi:hypothetical protein
MHAGICRLDSVYSVETLEPSDRSGAPWYVTRPRVLRPCNRQWLHRALAQFRGRLSPRPHMAG